jgi:hypothetical protein
MEMELGAEVEELVKCLNTVYIQSDYGEMWS